MNSKLYKECIIRYGNNIRILIRSKTDDFIYNLYDSDNIFISNITKDDFQTEIPKILLDNYTVLMLEYFDDSLELTTVHYPRQSNLTLPPIFI